MNWIDNFKKWFWGNLKPELQEPQFEKPKPPETTDEVLEEVVEKEPEVKKKPARKRTAAKKPVEKKKSTAKKPRKPKQPRGGKK